MLRLMRIAGLLVALSIGESCGLKPPAVPHLDVRGAVSGAGRAVAEVTSSRAAEMAVASSAGRAFDAGLALDTGWLFGPAVLPIRPVRPPRG